MANPARDQKQAELDQKANKTPDEQAQQSEMNKAQAAQDKTKGEQSSR